MSDTYLCCVICSSTKLLEENRIVVERPWREVRATRSGDKWYYNPMSRCVIFVCPNCSICGEPGLN